MDEELTTRLNDPRTRKEAVAAGLRDRFPEWNAPTVSVDVTFGAGGSRLARFWVSPDYAGIPDVCGVEYLRVPADPRIYQAVADARGWSFPVPPLVDAVFATVPGDRRSAPRTMGRDRGEWTTVVRHNARVEADRVRMGIPLGALWCGAKKDIVVGVADPAALRTPRVWLYGWHRPDGARIQGLFGGHAVSYVDYSHGWRPVLGEVEVDGQVRPYAEVVADGGLMREMFPEWHARLDATRYRASPNTRY